MRRLFVDKKTGFRVTDVYKPIIIRDERGISFYNTEPLVPKTTEFNLPPGEYYVDSGAFVKAAIPVWYPRKPMPFQQRIFMPDPGKFKIEFGINPNKCSVLWDEGVILFDESFLDRPRNEVDFILGHEMGHRYYKTEAYCDLYAANLMLKWGYNPYQIGMSSIDSLSDNAESRKLFIIDKL